MVSQASGWVRHVAADDAPACVVGIVAAAQDFVLIVGVPLTVGGDAARDPAYEATYGGSTWECPGLLAALADALRRGVAVRAVVPEACSAEEDARWRALAAVGAAVTRTAHATAAHVVSEDAALEAETRSRRAAGGPRARVVLRSDAGEAWARSLARAKLGRFTADWDEIPAPVLRVAGLPPRRPPTLANEVRRLLLGDRFR